MTPSQIEKVKLRAAFLNSVASSSFVAAIVSPAIGLSIGTVGTTFSWQYAASASAFWIVLSVILHLMASRTLDSLE